MKNSTKFISAVTLLLTFVACSPEDPGEPTPPVVVPPTAKAVYLSVAPVIAPLVETKGIITQFTDNDQIGLFVTDGDLGSNYNNNPDSKNLPVSFVLDKWSADKRLEIETNGNVFGYYPYNAAAADGTGIPVETASQTDYLYAVKSPISITAPEAKLGMKHALSLISVRVRKNEYQYAGKLEKVEIVGVQTIGTMNIATGAVTKAGEATTVLREPNITLDDNILAKTSSIVLPTNIAEAGNVKIKVNVDGNICTYDVPSVHNWEPGYEYTYTLNMNKMQEIAPDVEFEVEYWTKFGKDDNIVIGSNAAYSKLDIQMGPTSYGRTIVTGEAYIFSTVVTNKNTTDFKGKIKLTLWDGDKMIEQFPAYNIKCSKGFFRTFSIPSFINCEPGIYKLRPLLQEEGKTEWFIASDRYSEEIDWMFTVQEKSNIPSLRKLNIEGFEAASTLIRFVKKDKLFNVEYTLTNRANISLKGEIKAVWERTFTNEFRLASNNDGNTWEDEIGETTINIDKNIKEYKGELSCCINIERNCSNWSEAIHLYFKAEGTTEWILMRSDADQELQRWKEITGPENMFILGGINYIYVTLEE